MDSRQPIPEDPILLIDSASERLEAGDASAALDAARRAHTALAEHGEGESPDAANALRLEAEAALGVGDLAQAGAASHAADALMTTTELIDDAGLRRLRFEVALTRARTLRAMGQLRAAHRRLATLSHDTAAAAGPVGERCHLLNEQGVTFKYLGRFQRAERCYREALTLVDARHEPGLLATLHHNLGGALHAMGRLEAAEAQARRGLALRETCALTGCLAVAADRVALAAILIDAGRHAEAEALLGSARLVYVRELHPHHLEVGHTLLMESRVALARGEAEVACARAEAALAIMEDRLGSGHADTSYARATLALALHARGDGARAAAAAGVALAAASAALGESHPRTRDLLALRRSLTP